MNYQDLRRLQTDETTQRGIQTEDQSFRVVCCGKSGVMSKKEIMNLKKAVEDSAESIDSLLKMIETPDQYFKDNPIEETWDDPPQIPTKAEFDNSMKPDCNLKEQIRVYCIIAQAVHCAKRASRLQKDYDYITDSQAHRKQEEIIAKKLRKAGYQVHTQSNVSQWNTQTGLNVIHHGFSEFELHEIPQIKGTNHKINDYLFDKEDNLRTYPQLIEAYQEDNAELKDFETLTEDLDEKEKQMLKEFMSEEGLTYADISDVKESDYESGLFVDTFSREYTIFESEDEAKRIAFNQIDEDDEMEYFYTEGIKADTIDPIQTSFPDWIELVKSDGWAHHLSRYDGDYTLTQSGFCYIREN